MLKIYNTLTKKKEVFKPFEDKKVGMYNCGPTVYSFAHIGNLRAFIMADVIRRWLEYLGYQVRQVKNITDVGHLTEQDVDKMVVAARKERKSPKQIARFYIRAFFEDEKKLNIKPAHVFPRATEHLGEMIKLIETLIKKDYAYEKKGSVFFNINKFENYGQLSGNTLKKLKTGARLKVHPDKINPFDFALWLKAPREHLMKWRSPWGLGYPGWHIECSAMSLKYLTNVFKNESFYSKHCRTIDIHTGGEDNIFPHHENEIAQSEAAMGKKFVKYWIHCGWLLVAGEKMAKSKGNYYTLRDLEQRNYNPLVFRLLILGAHHRSKFNFTFRGLKQAQEGLERIVEFLKKLKTIKRRIPKGKVGKEVQRMIKKTKRDFEEYMDDDFNTPRAIAQMFDLIKESNKLIDQNKLNPVEAETLYDSIIKFDQVLGILPTKIVILKIPPEIKKLVQKREKARGKKQWRKADKIRREIEKNGYKVEDTATGSKIEEVSFAKK